MEQAASTHSPQEVSMFPRTFMDYNSGRSHITFPDVEMGTSELHIFLIERKPLLLLKVVLRDN